LDMDDVLFDTTVWHRWLFQLLGRVGVHSEFESLFCTWENDYLNSAYLGKRDYWDAFQSFLLAIGLSRGQVDEVILASRGRQRWFETSLRPFPGVVAALNQLATQGVTLGILCNSHHDGSYVQQVLKRFKLDRAVRHVIVSSSHGLSLTHQEFFRIGLRALNATPSETAFVSHDCSALLMAKSLGIQPVGFNVQESVDAPDFVLDRFSQLTDIGHPQTPYLMAG